MHVKAAVEQPIFVTPLAAIAKRTAPAMTAQPIDKVAMNKLATALREQPTDKEAVGSVGGATLAIPIDDGRKLFAEGLVAFAKGAPSLSAPPRLETPARLSGSATRSIRRLSPVSASSGSKAMRPRRATIILVRSPPARPGLASESRL